MRNLLKIRAIISTLLIIAFTIVLFSGIGLYFAPSGKIAELTNWHFFGFSKLKLGKLHTLFAFIMSGLVIVHLFLNYKMFLGEVKMLFEKRNG